MQLIADVGQFAINPAIRSKLSYGSIEDFTPICTAANSPLFLAVHAAEIAKAVNHPDTNGTTVKEKTLITSSFRRKPESRV